MYACMYGSWMDGTCKECEPVQLQDDEEILYTFWNDISKNPVVVKMMLTVTQSMQTVIHDVDKFVDGWKRYDRAYHLWNQKKLGALEVLLSSVLLSSLSLSPCIELISPLFLSLLSLCCFLASAFQDHLHRSLRPPARKIHRTR